MHLATTQPTTVLYLHGSADLYGADRTLLQLVQGLDRDRFRAIVALPVHGPLVAALQDAGAHVEIGPLGVGCRASMSAVGIARLLWDLPRAVGFVRRLTRRYRPSIIHTNTIVVLGGAIGAWTARVPHLWHVHEILPASSFVSRFFVRALHTLSDLAVSNSRCTRASFGAEAQHEHHVVHNGSEVESLDDSLTTKTNTTVLLVGRVNSWKGQQLLVDAAASLHARFPDVRYRIVGDAPTGQEHFERELDAHIQAAGLGKVVTRAGFAHDTAAEYRAADIVVIPSTRPEPFGLVAIEAMAHGLPVVAANHGGLSEIVVHRHTGLLFIPGSKLDLTHQLGTLLDDPWQAKQLGKNGRNRQARHFSVSRYCAEFADLYEQIQVA